MEGIKLGERHPLAHEKGGFRPQDPEGLVPDAIKDVLKKVGSKIATLQFFDLMKISAPAKTAYPTTYLECFLNDYTYFPKYMAKVCKTKDSMERLKNVTTCILAGLHVGQIVLQALSPLNPILGETWQRYSSDGTKYFAEQISHHPPISAGTMEGPDGAWRFEVIQEFKAGLSGHNSIKAHKEGALVITINDGTQYIIEEGHLSVDGLVYGELVVTVCGKLIIKDITHEMTAEVIFNPDANPSSLSSIASKLKFWGSKKTQRPADHFDVFIYEGDVENKNVVWQGKGSYLEYIEFEGERYWEIGEEWGQWHQPDFILESDSSLRLDLNYIKEKDYIKAQEEKEKLENAQRADKKLREAAKKK